MEATNEGVSIQDRLSNYLLGEESPLPEEIETEVTEITEDEEPRDLEFTDESQDYEESQEDGVSDEAEPLDLSVIAQSIGLDINQLDVSDDGLYVKTKIDGQEGRAKFTDLLKSYQLEGHLNKKDTALAEKIKQVEQRKAELEEQANQRLNHLDDSLKLAYSQLNYDAQNIQKLEEEDPEEYVRQRLKLQDRHAQLNQAYQALQWERQEQEKKKEQAKAERLQSSAQRLVESIPEWNNAEIASKEKSEVMHYAMNNGYSVDDLNGIDDYRLIVALRKAMKFDQMQTKKPEITAKVKKAPKFVKPGQSVPKPDRKTQELQQAQSRLKKTGGSKGTVADYLLKKGIV